MAEDVAQIEADGSDSDTCHSERGEEIGPAKWGQTGSQTCSALVSVFKSPCAATLLLSSNQGGRGGQTKKEGGKKCVVCALWKVEDEAVAILFCSHPLPFRLLGLAVQNELTGLTEVHCA